MDKNLIKLNACRDYVAMSATDREILCFARGGMVWAVEIHDVDSALLFAITTIEQRSSGWVLRYRPNKKQQEIILSRSKRTEIICTLDFLEAEKAKHKGNRGDTVEYLVTKMWGGVQPKARNEKFTECGDFSLNGFEYQVKYGAKTGAATFTDEKTINSLRGRA